MTISRTVISLRVSVPVLSEQMTVTEPRVSTLGSLRTKALRRTRRCKPIASTSVTTAGRPSGTAATARLTDSRNDGKSGPPRSAWSRKMRAAIPSTMAINTFPSSASRCWSGVGSRSVRWSKPAICPSSVAEPVATTTASALPAATVVPR